MKTIVCIYSICKGTRIKVWIDHATIEAKAITKVTAAPIPSEVFTLDDTPKKGQIPRNCAKTTLFTNIAPMIIAKYESSITTS
jgi:hypothetical protein